MAEILSGMKVLKLYAWEPAFEKEISQIRKKEVRTLKQSAYLDAVAYASWFVVTPLVSTDRDFHSVVLVGSYQSRLVLNHTGKVEIYADNLAVRT